MTKLKQADEDMLMTMTATLRNAMERGYSYALCIDNHGGREVMMHNLPSVDVAVRMAVKIAKLQLPERPARRKAA